MPTDRTTGVAIRRRGARRLVEPAITPVRCRLRATGGSLARSVPGAAPRAWLRRAAGVPRLAPVRVVYSFLGSAALGRVACAAAQRIIAFALGHPGLRAGPEGSNGCRCRLGLRLGRAPHHRAQSEGQVDPRARARVARELKAAGWKLGEVTTDNGSELRARAFGDAVQAVGPTQRRIKVWAPPEY
jgi:hypothetical protein